LESKSSPQGSESPPQEGDCDPLSILSSGTEKGEYITFDETRDTDIFGFFEELPRYHVLIKELGNLLEVETSVDKDIILKLQDLQISVRNKEIKEKLNSLDSNLNKDYVTRLIKEVPKCDFTLFKEFLRKVKIFQNQSNENSLKGLIEKELQQACKAPPSVVNFIYTKFEEGFSKWRGKDGNVEWLNKNSGLWQAVQKHIISGIKEISESEIQEIDECGIRFNQQHVQKLSDAIKRNTALNIVTKSNMRNLQKVKTYQALNILGYNNSLFVGIKSLMTLRKEINKLWPCKWSEVLVLECDSDGKVAQTLLDILQQSADCEQGLDISDETLVDFWQKYQQKVILISTRKRNSVLKEKLRNICMYFGDNFDISDLDEKSQKKILESPVNFQGNDVALSTLVGTDPPECMKLLLDSDIISILLSGEPKLSFGRQLDDHPKYYVPRVLQHQVYLKEEIMKLTDYTVTIAVSGLQADELKKYLPDGEKICEFVYDERGRSRSFKIVSDFAKTGLRAELGNTNPYNKAGQNIKPDEVRYIILGNRNTDSEFRELKELCRNVYWIHVEEGSFLWKDTNGNINIIRRYIDKTKCENCDMKVVVEHKDRTMLLVAEPGMGKSTFFSYMAHEIKKRKPSVWVLRINLNEHTNKFDDTGIENKSIDKCKKFLWSAAHSPEQDVLEFIKEIFQQALEQTGKMVIILDGFDEISPDYSPKVMKLITTIRDETASKIWISSRFPYRQELDLVFLCERL
jgi:hypothetical protein